MSGEGSVYTCNAEPNIIWTEQEEFPQTIALKRMIILEFVKLYQIDFKIHIFTPFL